MMNDTVLIMYGYGSKETKTADEFLSSGVATPLSSRYLVQEKAVSWDDLEPDVVAELMLWENASDQDLRYLDGLAE